MLIRVLGLRVVGLGGLEFRVPGGGGLEFRVLGFRVFRGSVFRV